MNLTKEPLEKESNKEVWASKRRYKTIKTAIYQKWIAVLQLAYRRYGKSKTPNMHYANRPIYTMQIGQYAHPKLGDLQPLNWAIYFSISPICFFINEDSSLSYPQFANNQPFEWCLLKEDYYALFSWNIYLILSYYYINLQSSNWIILLAIN